MTNRLIGVDCDLTICRSDLLWVEWLINNCSYSNRETWEGLHSGWKIHSYDLGLYFPSIKDPMDYWRELDYDQFEPIEGSVEALQKLSEYFGIVFISSIKGNHNKSKYYWLKKHFPFMEGYIATKEKYLMGNSVVGMIDDRKSHLAGFDHHKRILFETNYDQKGFEDIYIHKSFSDWKQLDIKQLIEEYL